MERIIKEIIDFRDKRCWNNSDNPENLAKSIVIEAGKKQ